MPQKGPGPIPAISTTRIPVNTPTLTAPTLINRLRAPWTQTAIAIGSGLQLNIDSSQEHFQQLTSGGAIVAHSELGNAALQQPLDLLFKVPTPQQSSGLSSYQPSIINQD